MTYIKAQIVLPEEIIRLIQEYVDGECLYIQERVAMRSLGVRRMAQGKVLKIGILKFLINTLVELLLLS